MNLLFQTYETIFHQLVFHLRAYFNNKNIKVKTHPKQYDLMLWEYRNSLPPNFHGVLGKFKGVGDLPFLIVSTHDLPKEKIEDISTEINKAFTLNFKVDGVIIKDIKILSDLDSLSQEDLRTGVDVIRFFLRGVEGCIDVVIPTSLIL